MPVAQGIMQMDRLNIRPTTTTFSSFSPSSPAACGVPISTTVQVQSTSLFGMDDVRPTGIVQIVRTEDSTVVGSGTLSDDIPTNQSTVTINLTLSNSSNTLVARYVGALNNFASSESSTSSYAVTLIATAVAFTVPTPSGTANKVCAHNTISLTARVQRSPPGIDVSTGLIGFRLYSDETNFTTLSAGVAVNGTGFASFTVPADTLVAPNTYGIQARYIPSDPCISGTQSAPGISGSTTKFQAITADTGTIILSTADTNVCASTPNTKQFTATISGLQLPLPSIGTASIYKYGIEFGPSYLLGSATPVSGVATINVAPGNWSIGAQDLKVYYVGDGFCYGNFDNSSSPLSIDGYVYSYNLNASITYSVFQSLPNPINHTITSDAIYITYTPVGSAPEGFFGYVETIFTKIETGQQVIYRQDHFTGQSSILIGIANTSFIPGTYSYDGHIVSYDAGHCGGFVGAGSHIGNFFNVI